MGVAVGIEGDDRFRSRALIATTDASSRSRRGGWITYSPVASLRGRGGFFEAVRVAFPFCLRVRVLKSEPSYAYLGEGALDEGEVSVRGRRGKIVSKNRGQEGNISVAVRFDDGSLDDAVPVARVSCLGDTYLSRDVYRRALDGVGGAAAAAGAGQEAERGARAATVAPASFEELEEGTALWGFRAKSRRDPEKWEVREVLVQRERIFSIRFKFLKLVWPCLTEWCV